MTENTRRSFLTNTGAAVLGACALPSTRVFAQPSVGGSERAEKGNTLVVIYLQGGADALNVVVPYSNPMYYTVRPTIARPPPAMTRPCAAVWCRSAAPCPRSR